MQCFAIFFPGQERRWQKRFHFVEIAKYCYQRLKITKIACSRLMRFQNICSSSFFIKLYNFCVLYVLLVIQKTEHLFSYVRFDTGIISVVYSAQVSEIE